MSLHSNHSEKPTQEFYLLDDDGTQRRICDEFVEWATTKSSNTLKISLSLVPWILQQAYVEGREKDPNFENTVVHRGSAAVALIDCDGISPLLESLSQRENGAEELSHQLGNFFTPLMQLINNYRGDVTKFNFDKINVIFPAMDDSLNDKRRKAVPPHGSFGRPDLGPEMTCVLRAAAFCVEVHKRLHNFDTNVCGVRLNLRIGVGFGRIAVLQVGGEIPPDSSTQRFEYLIAGQPIEQATVAGNLARVGESCLSPQAWEQVRDCVVEDTSRKLEDRPDYHLLLKMDEAKFTFPTIKRSAMLRDTRHLTQFKISQLGIIRRYVHPSVFKQIQDGTLRYVNELRSITYVQVFLNLCDVDTDEGAHVLQTVVSVIQANCYAHEGSVSKILLDSKGVFFVFVFGLPPLVHTDDTTRAVMFCLDSRRDLDKLGFGLQCTGKGGSLKAFSTRFAVTTGKAFCGFCGSEQRMEYTVLGESVSLARQLVLVPHERSILVDQNTAKWASDELEFEQLECVLLKVCQGHDRAVNIYCPMLRKKDRSFGVTPTGAINFPWYNVPAGGICKGPAPWEIDEFSKAIRANMMRLCGLSDWSGIKQLQRLLGASFEAETHMGLPFSNRTRSTASACSSPESSPSRSRSRFSRTWSKEDVVYYSRHEQTPEKCVFDGAMILTGKPGSGKVELAEHTVVFCARHLGAVPLFGSMGPRPHDMERLAVEVLRSLASAHRYLDKTLPEEDVALLSKLMQSKRLDSFSQVCEAIEGPVARSPEQRKDLLLELVDVVVALIMDLRTRSRVLLVLQLNYGATVYQKTKEQMDCFWDVVTTLALATQRDASKTGAKMHEATVLIITPAVDTMNPTVAQANREGRVIDIPSLSKDDSAEYVAMYLGVPKGAVPTPLVRFLYKISSGNPLYIRETLEQMRKLGHLEVVGGKNITYDHNLDRIKINAFAQTAMVGEMVCLIEALEPLEAAVLKISTAFSTPFTLSDIASSLCSRWTGAGYYDLFRLYSAVCSLVSAGFFERVRGAAECGSGSPKAFERKVSAVSSPKHRKIRPSVLSEQSDQAAEKVVCSSHSTSSNRNSVVRSSSIDSRHSAHSYSPSPTSRLRASSSNARPSSVSHCSSSDRSPAKVIGVSQWELNSDRQASDQVGSSTASADCAQSAPRQQLEKFVIKNVLIRRVSSSMVLDSQQKSARRKAILWRALSRSLPERLKQVKEQNKKQHIPWYYEDILTRKKMSQIDYQDLQASDVSSNKEPGLEAVA